MRTGRFAHFLAIDWSGAKGPRQKGIALARAHADGGPPVLVDAGKGWGRADVLTVLQDTLSANTLVGLDLGIGLPFHDCGAFFPGNDPPASPASAKELWALVDAVSSSDPHLFVGTFIDDARFAPFFRRDGAREGSQFRCDAAMHGRGRFRITETAQAAMGCKPYSNFNLIGAAQVGKSSLSGMRMLHRLNGCLPVWPVDPLPETGSVIVEIYTTLAAMAAGRRPGASKIRDWESLDRALKALGSPTIGKAGPIDDHSSDALLSAAWLRRVAATTALWHPPAMTPAIARTEGWTFGAY